MLYSFCSTCIASDKDDEMPVNISSANKKLNVEGQPNLLASSVFVSVLQEIGRRCDSKVVISLYDL